MDLDSHDNRQTSSTLPQEQEDTMSSMINRIATTMNAKAYSRSLCLLGGGLYDMSFKGTPSAKIRLRLTAAAAIPKPH